METQENEKFVETFLSRAATSVALVVSLFLINYQQMPKTLHVGTIFSGDASLGWLQAP